MRIAVGTSKLAFAAAFAFAVVGAGTAIGGDGTARPHRARSVAKLYPAGMDSLWGLLSPEPRYVVRRTWLTRPADAPEPRARGLFVEELPLGDGHYPEETTRRCRVRGLRPRTTYFVRISSWYGYAWLVPPTPYTRSDVVRIPFTTDAAGAGAAPIEWFSELDGYPAQIAIYGNPFDIVDADARVVLHGIVGGGEPSGRVQTKSEDATSGATVVARLERRPTRPIERLSVIARGLPPHADAELYLADADGTPTSVAGAKTNAAGRVRIVVDAAGSRPLPFGEPDVTRYSGRAFEVKVQGRAVASGTMPAFAGSTLSPLLTN